MKIYYIILVNGVPEQVTEYWARAKQAALELESRNRETRIVTCVEALPFAEPDFDEAPTEPDMKLPDLEFGSDL